MTGKPAATRAGLTAATIFTVLLLLTACSGRDSQTAHTADTPRAASGDPQTAAGTRAGTTPSGTTAIPAGDGRQWYEQPMRILQTVLREVDAKNYDAASVVAHMKETHSNVLVVNAGGIIDFFDNPLPAAMPNRFLEEGDDVLRDIVRACHDAGFRVIARVDFRGVFEEIYNENPGWFARDVNGNPITLTYTRWPLYIPCYESYYRNEHALEFISYLFDNYNIDGIWHNSVQVYDMCYCDRCESLYDEAFGAPLPVAGRSSDSEMDRYYDWKSTRASAHMERLKSRVREYGSDKAYVAEVFGMYDVGGPIRSGIDLYTARDHFDFLVSVNFLTENRRHIEYKNLGYSASIVRFLKALDPAKQSVILFGQNGTSHRYIMEPDTDSRIFMWQAAASGGTIWNCSFTGQHPGATYDRRNALLLEEVNRFISEKGSAFDNTLPSADLHIYYSRSTRTHFGSDDPAGDTFGASIQGIERMCRDNHIQYGFLPDEGLTAEGLSEVKVLVMPNVASLSDREAGLVKEWVRQGGRLIATFETSLYDEQGDRRPDFAFAELFGVSHTGTVADTQMDCYQWIDDHSLVLPAGMEQTRMLINSGQTVLADVTSPAARVVSSYMPRLINQSPEMAWVPEEEMRTAHPTLVVNSYGEGEVVYFANQPGRTNHLMGHPDFDAQLHGAVQHLLNGETTVTTNAPASVHVWVNESNDDGQKRYVVSMVNLTGGPERPLRSLTPVRDIEVTLRLPEGKRFSAQVLREEGKVTTRQRGNTMTIRAARLDEFISVELTEV